MQISKKKKHCVTDCSFLKLFTFCNIFLLALTSKIVFDECHKAKNLCPTGSSKPTKTGQTVLELQNRLPKARVIYASATGASEPKNMAYMTRLGLWGPGTPFKEFNDFIQAVERRYASFFHCHAIVDLFVARKFHVVL